MDWLTFVTSQTKALAWPLVALLALLLLRNELRKLLVELGRRLEKAKAGGFEATFREGVSEIEEKLPPTPKVERPGDRAALAHLAALPPRYIVTEAWLKLENALREVLPPDPDTPPAHSVSAFWLLKEAVKTGRISPDEYDTLSELRLLRNRVAHAEDVTVSPSDALRYASIVERVIVQLKDDTKRGGGISRVRQ
ncbi:hypothetical protein ACFQX4_11840 [Roseomonas sp. GCM10028921]